MTRKIFGTFILLILCAFSSPVLAQAQKPSSAHNPVPVVDFLPQPHVVGSPDYERDVAIFHAARKQKKSSRWKQAIYDAKDKENLEALFLDAFGLRIDSTSTPETLALMNMVTAWLAKTINPAKNHYRRVRPFTYFNVSGESCVPHDESWLKDNGSYPSGHSARGWGWALVLAEISPERQGAILRRGYELGQSRVICGVHWQSDVESARIAAGAVIVQLHHDPEFMRTLVAAKREIARLREPEAKQAYALQTPEIRKLPDNFVYVSELVPDALLDIRYYNSYNFVGARVDGYRAPVAVLVRPAAKALVLAANAAREQGYLLRIFDAYRPQEAVNHFVRWAKDPEDTGTKAIFYPDVDKPDLFARGYIMEKSGHTRGATVDLTLVDRATGRELDMGSAFDYFGVISHHGAAGISSEQADNRKKLRSIMISAGFVPYEKEWWHYTLRNEPYPDTYFDFPVE